MHLEQRLYVASQDTTAKLLHVPLTAWCRHLDWRCGISQSAVKGGMESQTKTQQPTIHVTIVEFKQSIAFAGCGAEASIGQLTRLTSLLLSVDRRLSPRLSAHWSTSSTCNGDRRLQLQLLGGSGSGSDASNGSHGGNRSCPAGMAASGNTSLQELTLEWEPPLLDDELAAAAVALPDLRQLALRPSRDACPGLWGFKGAGLEAFGACHRLRDISLYQCNDVEGQQLVTHVPQISSHARLQLTNLMRPMVSDRDAQRLREAFHLKHGRHLQVMNRR